PFVLRCSVSSCYADSAPRYISTLSLHDALPIFGTARDAVPQSDIAGLENAAAQADEPVHYVLIPEGNATSEVGVEAFMEPVMDEDRKSTRLNSSHVSISYAVFCLKKKQREEKPC